MQAFRNEATSQLHQNGYTLPTRPQQAAPQSSAYYEMNQKVSINTPYHHHQQQQAASANANASRVGLENRWPSKVVNLSLIQQQLGNASMDEYTVLYYAQKAVSDGVHEADKAWMYNQYCHIYRYDNYRFVLTEGFDAVITIIWDPQPTKFIANRSSTFRRNTSHSQQPQLSQPAAAKSAAPAIASYHHATQPSHPQHVQPPQQQQSQPPLLKRSSDSNKSVSKSMGSKSKLPLIDTATMEFDEIEIVEFEELLDEIADGVALDVDNDPELTDYHQTPFSNKSSAQHSPQLSVSHGQSVDVRVSQSLWNELCHRFRGRSHFAQNREELAYTVQQLIIQYHLDRVPLQQIGDHQQWYMWVDRARCFVYITESDKSTLLDVFDSNQFSQQYVHCLLQLKQRKYSMSTTTTTATTTSTSSNMNNVQATNQLNLPHYAQLQHKLVTNNYSGRSILSHNASGRSILSHTTSGRSIVSNATNSRRSVFLDVNTNNNNNNNNHNHNMHGEEKPEMKNNLNLNNNNNNSSHIIKSDHNTTSSNNVQKHEYHTIYLKPIIERMKAMVYSASTEEGNPAIDSAYIIGIVDNSIKYGSKRQISKRTFEFKWNSYTCIMSKSLKTILDVTSSRDAEIITVHPDVVSIISKKCPQLDYFTIQKLAKQAKASCSCTTKKNDYRQQFIYDYCGCRIVFASNHTTIVEMQCNDPSAIQIN